MDEKNFIKIVLYVDNLLSNYSNYSKVLLSLSNMTKTKSIKTHFSGLNNNFNREAETFKRKKKSNKRNRNKPNFCLICKTNVTNLRRHLLSEHKDKCILLDGKLSIKDSVTLPKLVECFRHNTSLIYVDTNGNHLKVYENEVNTTEAGNETQVNCSNLVLNFTNKKEAGEINGNVPFPKYNDAGKDYVVN